MGLFDRFRNKQDESVNEISEFDRWINETKTDYEGDSGVGIMYLPPKIKKRPKDLTELDKLKNIEIDLYYKMGAEEGYYGSEFSKVEFRKLKEYQRDYIKRNPTDYRTRGADFYPYLWRQIDVFPKEKIEIVDITGKGLYYEDLEEYEQAIGEYQKAYDLCWIVFKKDLEELIEEMGEGDYLWTADIVTRINVCKNKIHRNKVKKLEAEAKEMESIDPKQAIIKYEELNELNPNLKKYNKRIYRMMELEAKELEKTDPLEAIKKYQELNELNSGLKKYNKRIEIIERKLKKQ